MWLAIWVLTLLLVKNVKWIIFLSFCFPKDMKSIKQSMLLCCKLYVSESCNHGALDSIERAGRLDGETVIVNKFQDRAYNRIGYTLVSYIVHDSTRNIIYSPLQQSLQSMPEAAYEAINLELHCGAHPRLGVVDDIVFHLLAQASLEEATWFARKAAADIGNKFQGNSSKCSVIDTYVLQLQPCTSFLLMKVYVMFPSAVPVFLYDAAHPMGKPLDFIQRELGYYRPNFMGNQWCGWDMPEILPEKPDVGPNMVSQARGIVMIGALPWDSMYNIPIASTDISATRRSEWMVSARGGGLPTVQTLGLFHGKDSTEIACQLLEPNRFGAGQVQYQVEMLAAQEGLDVEKGYFTDFSPDMIIEKYLKLISGDESH